MIKFSDFVKYKINEATLAPNKKGTPPPDPTQPHIKSKNIDDLFQRMEEFKKKIGTSTTGTTTSAGSLQLYVNSNFKIIDNGGRNYNFEYKLETNTKIPTYNITSDNDVNFPKFVYVDQKTMNNLKYFKDGSSESGKPAQMGVLSRFFGAKSQKGELLAGQDTILSHFDMLAKNVMRGGKETETFRWSDKSIADSIALLGKVSNGKITKNSNYKDVINFLNIVRLEGSNYWQLSKVINGKSSICMVGASLKVGESIYLNYYDVTQKKYLRYGKSPIIIKTISTF